MKLCCRACGIHISLESGRLTCTCGRPLTKVAPPSKPPSLASLQQRFVQGENSWSLFREVLGSWHLAQTWGLEKKWEQTLATLDADLRRTPGRGLEATPLTDAQPLERALGLPSGTLFAKNEFDFVMGSHKARHMISSALYLETLRHKSGAAPTPLSIFSCGNAALGAAAVAHALHTPLATFVPDTIDPHVEGWLTGLGATVVKVRREGSVGEGDPCHNRYQESLRSFGWSPFSCYGNDTWASVEGAQVLGLEFFLQLLLQENKKNSTTNQPLSLDALVVQVGGGGLAHGLSLAVESALEMGLLANRPRLYFIQTSSCYPLAESWFRLGAELLCDPIFSSTVTVRKMLALSPTKLQAIAASLAAACTSPRGAEVLTQAAQLREKWFPPWAANVPHSVAEGILDDTTYDGFEISEALFRSQGLPWVVEERELEEAASAVQHAGPPNVSATGTAALAGCRSLQRAGMISSEERVALLLTGVESRPTPPRNPTGRSVLVGAGDDLKQALAARLA